MTRTVKINNLCRLEISRSNTKFVTVFRNDVENYLFFGTFDLLTTEEELIKWANSKLSNIPYKK
jgi:hypothetical protein